MWQPGRHLTRRDILGVLLSSLAVPLCGTSWAGLSGFGALSVVGPAVAVCLWRRERRTCVAARGRRESGGRVAVGVMSGGRACVTSGGCDCGRCGAVAGVVARQPSCGERQRRWDCGRVAAWRGDVWLRASQRGMGCGYGHTHRGTAGTCGCGRHDAGCGLKGRQTHPLSKRARHIHTFTHSKKRMSEGNARTMTRRPQHSHRPFPAPLLCSPRCALPPPAMTPITSPLAVCTHAPSFSLWWAHLESNFGQIRK